VISSFFRKIDDDNITHQQVTN